MVRYDAFVSYSHELDSKLAAAVRVALHKLAKPWYRVRAVSVFLDQSSLSANPALWPAIEQALSRSTYFLLLASRHSARSPWVQREVEWWLRHRSVDTLLVLLTDGDLVWNAEQRDYDWEKTTALGRAAAGAFQDEPLYVDFRWTRGEGIPDLSHPRFRSAILALAAPLHGRKPDEIDGEDVRQLRRTKRVAWGAAAALAVAFGIAVWQAILANQQRAEAQRAGMEARNQRDEAERQRKDAQSQRDEAIRQREMVLFRTLPFQARDLRERGQDRTLGGLLSLESLRRAPSLPAASEAWMSASLRMKEVGRCRCSGEFAVHPDGEWVAVVNGKGVDIWDATLQRRLRRLNTGAVSDSVKFSAKGSLIGVLGAPNVLDVWKTTDWKKVADGVRLRPAPRRHHEPEVAWQARSRRFRKLAFIGETERAVVYESALPGFTRDFYFSDPPSHGFIVDLRSGDQEPFAIPGNPLGGIRVSEDGRIAVVEAWGELDIKTEVFELAPRANESKLKWTVPEESPVAVSPTGAWVATRASDSINIRSTNHSGVMESITGVSDLSATQFAFGDSGMALLAYSPTSVRMFDLRKGLETGSADAEFATGGVVAQSGQVVYVADLVEGSSTLRALEPRMPVTLVDFDIADMLGGFAGETLIAGDERVASILTIESRSWSRDVHIRQTDRWACADVTGRWVAVTRDKLIQILDLNDRLGKPRTLVTPVAFSEVVVADNGHKIVGQADDQLFYWEGRDWRAVAKRAGDLSCSFTEFSQDFRWFTVFDVAQRVVEVYSTETWALIWQTKLKEIPGFFLHVASNQQGPWLALETAQGARIINLQTKKSTKEIKSTMKPVGAILSPQADRLALLDDGGIVSIVNVETGVEMIRFKLGFRPILATFTHDGRALRVLADGDVDFADDTSRAELWTLPANADELIRDGCDRIGRSLTPDEWSTHLPSVSYHETCTANSSTITNKPIAK
jgi:hypothetical protein